MTQTLNKHVKINVPYKVKARKTGKWDICEDLTILNDSPRTYNYQMEDYDGLQSEVNPYYNYPLVDVTGSVLPWKYDYSNILSKMKYAFNDYKRESISTEYVGKKELVGKYTKVGSPTITDKVLSNIDWNNYVYVPNSEVKTNIEIVLNATMPESTSVWPCIIGMYNTNSTLFIAPAGFLNYANDNGNAFERSSFTFLGKKVWIRLKGSSAGGTLCVMEDDGTYTLDTLPTIDSDVWTDKRTTTSSLASLCSAANYLYGINGVNTNFSFTGSIDLSQCCLIFNESETYLLYGNEYVPDIHITKCGNITVDNNGIASNFNSTNYLTKDDLTIEEDDTLYFKFTTPSTLSNCQLFWNANGEIIINAYSGNIQYWDSEIGSNTMSVSFSTNTTYYVKIQWTASSIIMGYSTNGQTYTTATYTRNNYPTNNWVFGQHGSAFSSAFAGTIDLTECYCQTSTGTKKWQAYIKHPTEILPGCLHHYDDTTKQAVTLNAFVIDGNDRIILSDLNNITTDDLNYDDVTFDSVDYLGTVDIPEHNN